MCAVSVQLDICHKLAIFCPTRDGPLQCGSLRIDASVRIDRYFDSGIFFWKMIYLGLKMLAWLPG